MNFESRDRRNRLEKLASRIFIVRVRAAADRQIDPTVGEAVREAANLLDAIDNAHFEREEAGGY